jgi:predicted O-methyltransferase YrrM
MQQLAADGEVIDLVFIDADKGGYLGLSRFIAHYWTLAPQRLRDL